MLVFTLNYSQHDDCTEWVWDTRDENWSERMDNNNKMIVMKRINVSIFPIWECAREKHYCYLPLCLRRLCFIRASEICSRERVEGNLGNFPLSAAMRANFGDVCARYHWVVVLVKYRNLAQRQMACYSFSLFFLIRIISFISRRPHILSNVACLDFFDEDQGKASFLINSLRVNDLIFKSWKCISAIWKLCANMTPNKEMKFTIHSFTRLRDSFRLMLCVYWFQLTNNPLFPFTFTATLSLHSSAIFTLLFF